MNLRSFRFIFPTNFMRPFIKNFPSIGLYDVGAGITLIGCVACIFLSSANKPTEHENIISNVKKKFFMTKNICLIGLGSKDNEKNQMHKKNCRLIHHGKPTAREIYGFLLLRLLNLFLF